jgi:hypothetical protein
MKHGRFDVFEYIVDEIWSITTNLLRSCGFAPHIHYMIEVMAHQKFYKDVRHDPLRPTVPKDPRTHCVSSSTLAAAPFRTTRSGGASSSSSANSSILKMFWGIFTMCSHTDQRMEVMEQCIEIVRHNQEIIHSQRDELLLKLSDVPIYPPVTDPYASLTPVELAAFGIGPARALDNDDNDDDDDDDEATNGNVETEDEE